MSSAQIARLIKLVKEKEAVQERLTSLQTEISMLESGEGEAPKRRGRKPGRPKGSVSKTTSNEAGTRKSKRLKEPLLKALSAAGSAGITVKELATKLKVKPGNVFSWFYTTGKKITGIKKVGEAKYAYSA
jgi:hypothetical protein